ncbi:MFS transporter [Paenibacillus sp. WLX2291]|uniref:MFS transporter n=1 Tax=Paenibacillus sp. WLX2291 TaxID=3296934 RepID=UPI0039843038
MATLFLIVIYLAFISLGIPDSMLGAAWPVLHVDIGAPFGAAGVLSIIAAGGTIVSSLASGRLIEKLGTGVITLISCCLTAGALLGFAFVPSLTWLAVLAIPLGIGAGAVDSGLNHFVASHYKAHHMSWLHCFWGVGATTGPIIMAHYIGAGSWRSGYIAVACVQGILVVILLLTLPLWGKVSRLRQAEKEQQRQQPILANEFHTAGGEPIVADSTTGARVLADSTAGEPVVADNIIIEGNVDAASHSKGGNANLADETNTIAANTNISPQAIPGKGLFRLRGVTFTLFTFLFYCGAETTVGLWGASFLVGSRQVAPDVAAGWISLYFAGITIGRFVTGFLTLRASNRTLILLGQVLAVLGAILLVLPLPGSLLMLGLILIGIGFAPIFPGLLHETPARFGEGNSARLIGYQMATAYTGATLLPPLFGLVASYVQIGLFPYVVLAFIVLMLYCSERVNRSIRTA